MNEQREDEPAEALRLFADWGRAVLAAHSRIRSAVRCARVADLSGHSIDTSLRVFAKLENEQATGSFKLRGATKRTLQPTAKPFASSVLCAVDSRSQCSQFGDASYAIQQNWILAENLVELGELIPNPDHRRHAAEDITIADLTGVAVQDIAIAELAMRRLAEERGAPKER